MDHSIGVTDSYYRPKEREILEDYLKVIDNLTIESDYMILNKQLKQLEEKSKEEEYIIKGKLKDRDQEIQSLLTRDQLKDEIIAGISDQLFEIKEKIKEFEKFRTA